MATVRGGITNDRARLDGRQADIFSFVLMFGFLVAAFSLSLVPVIASRLETDYGLTASQIGLLMSAFLLAYGLVQIPAGAAASRWGGPVLAVAFALAAAGSILFAFAPSFGWLAAGRVVQGLGSGVMLPASGAIMAARIESARLGRAWGVFGTGWGIGSIAALLILPSVAAMAGVRGAAVVAAAAALIAGAFSLTRGAFATRPAPPSGQARPRLWADLRVVAGTGSVNLLGVFNAAALAVGVGVLSWTPSFLTDEHSAGVATAAYLTAGLGAAQIFATPAGAALAARIGRLPTIGLAFAGLAVLAVLTPYLPTVSLVFVAIVLVGLGSMMYFSPAFSQIPLFVEDRLVGLANGYVNAEGFLGSLLAPWVFGILLDRGAGYTAGYLFLGACAAAGGVGVLVLSLARRRSTSTVSPGTVDPAGPDV